jgi:hypothetical protein
MFHKILPVFSFVILLCFTACHKPTPGINTPLYLTNGWKFKAGDSPANKEPSLSDKEWSGIITKDYWENQQRLNFDGYGWYRLKVKIPSSLKKNINANDSLKFFLGMIDDCDQVFLNGELIGQNNQSVIGGQPPPTAFEEKLGLSNTPRNYKVDLKNPSIFWDRTNLIAIRVFDQGGNGGLHGPYEPCISVSGLEDHIIINTDDFYRVHDNRNLDTVMHIKNTLDQEIKGNVSLIASRFGHPLLKSSYEVRLLPAQTCDIPVSLPISTDSTEIEVNFDAITLNKGFTTKIYVPYVLLKN